MNSNKKIIFINLIIAILLLTNLSHSNMLEQVFGVSARSKAMAGAAASSANDFSALYYNPANLSLCKKNQITIGYHHISTMLYTDPEEDKFRPSQVGKRDLSTVATCIRLPANLSFGVYLDAGLKNFLQMKSTTLNNNPSFYFYDNNLAIPSMVLGLSFKANKYFSAGVSIAHLIQTTLFQNNYIPNFAFLQNKNEDKFTSNLGGEIQLLPLTTLGVNWQLMKDLYAGLSYKMKVNNIIDIKSDNISNTSIGNYFLYVKMNGLLNFNPHQVTAALSYKPTKKLLIASDLVYSRWSDLTSLFLKAAAREDNPNTNHAQKFSYHDSEAANFKDTWVPSIGVEYTLPFKLALRAGYSYKMSPIPSPNNMISNTLDSNTHKIAFGAGYLFKINREIKIGIDGFAAINYLTKTQVNKSEQFISARSVNKYSFYGSALNAGIQSTIYY